MFSAAAFALTLIPGYLVPASIGCVSGWAAWAAFLLTCRRLGATGLEPGRTRSARMLWSLAGATAAYVPAVVLGYWAGYTLTDPKGWLFVLIPVQIAGTLAGLYLGERLHQIVPQNETEDYISIFRAPR